MKSYILVITILLLFLFGCTKTTDVKKSEKGVLLTGYVFNVETGNPVKNAKISLIGVKDTLTIYSPKGKYIFDITPGSYTLRIEKKGFETGEQTFKFSQKKDYQYDYILLKEKELTPLEKEAQVHLTNAVAAFNEGDLKKAKSELSIADSLTPNNVMVEEYQKKVNEKISLVVNSLYKEALGLEEKKKNKDALKIYEEILSYEPDNKKAKERLAAINELLTAKPKPKPEPKPKPAVNVETIYKQGLSLFSQGKYKAAIAKFNTVLRYKSNHSGAKTYRKKAQSRLKALGG